MCERICKICGGDNDVANIANKMGFRPDVAFLRVCRLEEFICNGVKSGFIRVPEKGDPAWDIIVEVMNKIER
jgi:hypothetical protein